MRRIIFACVLIILTMLLFSCANDKNELNSSQKFTLSELYRASVACVCVKCKNAADSLGYAEFEATDVLCGTCEKTIYIESDKAEAGDEFLVFLPDSRDRYTKKEISYLQIKNKEVSVNGSVTSYSAVKNYITELHNVITIPYSVYYYETRSELLAGCTDIVIGKVDRKPETSEKKVYVHTETTSIDKMMKCTDISIRVVSSLIGESVSGDTIHALYMQDTVISMTDTATLNTVSLGIKDIGEILPDNYYVFFLQKTQDSKQNWFFTANPVQGWLELSQDNLTAADKNVLFEDCPLLKNLVSELRIVSQQKENTHTGKTDVLGE